MIETVMSFALGFLVAGLAALLMLPILNRRAARLARQRIDGMFPMSMQEIAAERDALRAEFAVAQRRMERKVEAAQTKRQADMLAVGARTLEIAGLERQVEGRDASLAARKAEIDEALAQIAGLDRDLTGARGEAAAGLAALTALEAAHREILVDLKTVRRERDHVRTDLQAVLVREEAAREAVHRADMAADLATDMPESAEADAPAAAPPGLAPALDALRARHDEVAAERDALRASLRAAEDALAKALAERGPSTERDDAELRRRISDVADALTRRDRLPSVGAFPMPAVVRS